MAGQTPQIYANHTRWDPAYHFFVVPVAGINVVVTIWNLIKSPSLAAGWFVILAIAAVVAALKLRVYPLKAQDRIIRLEERLRLGQILQEPLRSRIPELTVDQLCGLRFASDAELPKLVERTLNEKLKRADIKKAIQTWRPDYWRV